MLNGLFSRGLARMNADPRVPDTRPSIASAPAKLPNFVRACVFLWEIPYPLRERVLGLLDDGLRRPVRGATVACKSTFRTDLRPE